MVFQSHIHLCLKVSQGQQNIRIPWSWMGYDLARWYSPIANQVDTHLNSTELLQDPDKKIIL